MITNVIKLMYPNTLISEILKIDFGWATLIISHAKIYTWYDEYGIWHQMCDEAKHIHMRFHFWLIMSLTIQYYYRYYTETDYISTDDCINQHYLIYDVLSHHMTKLSQTKINKLLYVMQSVDFLDLLWLFYSNSFNLILWKHKLFYLV